MMGTCVDGGKQCIQAGQSFVLKTIQISQFRSVGIQTHNLRDEKQVFCHLYYSALCFN